MRGKRTIYEGHTFQSRLESRWACYLSALDIPWKYEPKLIDLGGLRYLPDFWLPSHDLWLEVKGEIVNDKVGMTIVAKCEGVARVTGYPIVLAFYDPLVSRCAVFLPTGEMYGNAHWGVCPVCFNPAVLIRDGVERYALCPHKEKIFDDARPMSRLMFEAAQVARQLHR